MKLVRLRLSNFRSFCEDFTELDLDGLIFLFGPNGAGKTAALQALARLFSLDPAQRKIRKSDFHVPHDEKPDEAPAERKLWIEADFEFPELVGKGKKEAPAVPGNFAHMQLMGVDGPAQVRFRLDATLDQDDEIEENFTYVVKVDAEGNPLEQGRVAKHDRNAIQVHYLPGSPRPCGPYLLFGKCPQAPRRRNPHHSHDNKARNRRDDFSSMLLVGDEAQFQLNQINRPVESADQY